MQGKRQAATVTAISTGGASARSRRPETRMLKSSKPRSTVVPAILRLRDLFGTLLEIGEQFRAATTRPPGPSIAAVKRASREFRVSGELGRSTRFCAGERIRKEPPRSLLGGRRPATRRGGSPRWTCPRKKVGTGSILPRHLLGGQGDPGCGQEARLIGKNARGCLTGEEIAQMRHGRVRQEQRLYVRFAGAIEQMHIAQQTHARRAWRALRR